MNIKSGTIKAMKYTLTKGADIPKKDKFGIHLSILPNFDNCGIVVVETEVGHNQEFYDKQSSFNYFILEGSGTFFLDDEGVSVVNGDLLSVQPNVRIYYKGNLKMILITSPAWKPENEVETKPSIW
jgi:mannose-6-phosphate isomerase-like protein (cupin superfamily)